MSPPAPIHLCRKQRTGWPFPVPATNAFTADFPKPLRQALTLRLLNQFGQVVSKRQLPPFTEQMTWDIEDLARGVYFIEIQVEGKVAEVRKLVKN